MMISRDECASASADGRLPALFLLILAVSCGSVIAARADWRLVWSDEFEGKAIDRNHWTFDIGNGRSGNGWGNHELEYYTARPENAFVSNGVLHIVAVKENHRGLDFTSARMKTRGLFCQKYGKFEFRAKLPTGQGYWPALWLMPCETSYGGWPASGEIDVMENRGRDPGAVLGTIHFGGPGSKRDQSRGPHFKFPGDESVAAFHTYPLSGAQTRSNGPSTASGTKRKRIGGAPGENTPRHLTGLFI